LPLSLTANGADDDDYDDDYDACCSVG